LFSFCSLVMNISVCMHACIEVTSPFFFVHMLNLKINRAFRSRLCVALRVIMLASSNLYTPFICMPIPSYCTSYLFLNVILFSAALLTLATCPFSFKWKNNLSRCQFLICLLLHCRIIHCVL
jgi:hypothetical protein